jgi:hypothetical protein
MTTPAVISLSAAFSFGSGLTAEEPQALHRGLFPTTTNLQPKKRTMTNTLTEELRDTLLELVPSVLAAIEYTNVWQRDKLTTTPAEAREFHHRFVRDFDYGLPEFTEEQVDRALLDWCGRVGDDVLVRLARSPHLGKLLALPRSL